MLFPFVYFNISNIQLGNWRCRGTTAKVHLALDGPLEFSCRPGEQFPYEAGTSSTQALAWLGADVVKIEAPKHGDPGRGVGLSPNKEYSAYFCNWNANKRSVALNMQKPEGRDLFLRLLPGFDVFVENYGPGVVERLDIEYETLRAVHWRARHRGL